MFGMLAAVPLLGTVLVPRKKAKVETLEHNPKTGYVTRWEFNTVEEAEDFVRDLIPELTYIRTGKDDAGLTTTEIRSGYRDAVRVIQRGDIIETQWKIVSKKTGNTVLEGHINFGNIGMTWAWLENIRVNGQVVTRNTKHGISEYLIQPFRKAEYVRIEKTCDGYKCYEAVPAYQRFCQKCYLEKEAAYAEYDIKHNPDYLKDNKDFTFERILRLAEYRQKGA